jgi:hypothetical protein
MFKSPIVPESYVGGSYMFLVGPLIPEDLKSKIQANFSL